MEGNETIEINVNNETFLVNFILMNDLYMHFIRIINKVVLIFKHFFIFLSLLMLWKNKQKLKW